VGQDLVDHHLKEQGRNQGEDLHEEGGDEHVQERLAVSPKGRREPAEPEAARVDARAEEVARNQDDDRLDFRPKFVDREFPTNPRDGVDDAKQTGSLVNTQ
jgi:hypothetical protein